MFTVYEEKNGEKTAIATCWSESRAWLICSENTNVFKAAKGYRYTYERSA